MANDISFRILQDIARDLSGEVVNFPTFLDITFRVRTALKKPDLTIEELATLVGAEPLMSTRIIRLANSVTLNRSGRAIVDVNAAIARTGMEAVRSVSFAVAMEQLLASKKMAPFAAVSQRLWQHTMHVAALSRLLARKATRVAPDEAMFAGLIHDIGVFYLLSRAASFPELIAEPSELHQLLVQWHAEIGHALLAAMGLPEELLLVVQTHETDRPVESLKTLADVLLVANKLANLEHPWRDPELADRVDTTLLSQLFDADAITTLLAESADDLASLKNALGAT
ncbi:MAG TPA: HDOD domain-containing protein [Accumulibacter sp.]|uniref:HDOD domain-containing protein n=1 Tax=Accumulibacter sp. TaxID=2053492 RepID=UPI000ED39EAB|nr:HDOD domain-containing protein [Accumulibacter sp.]HCZ15172.1 metal-dependent phosphohydrolase [Accumulibacter sp.]HRF73482.1 HDOD domain-containing protein [Accumulibacter sp.]